MSRQLETELDDVMGTGETVHTALRITLGDGTPLLVATGEFEFEDDTFLGVMETQDALNMELTQAEDAMNFQLTNIELELGQFLINTPDVLSGTDSMLCVYVEKKIDGVLHKWLEDKISGEIRITGEIDGSVIPLKFVSDMDSGIYYGETLGKLFPDAENQNQIVIPPANDVNNYPQDYYNSGGGYLDDPLSPYAWKYQSYVLPEMNLLN